MPETRTMVIPELAGLSVTLVDGTIVVFIDEDEDDQGS